MVPALLALAVECEAKAVALAATTMIAKQVDLSAQSHGDRSLGGGSAVRGDRGS